MKQHFLKFGNKPKSYAPRMRSRRFPGLDHPGFTAYKDGDKKNDPEADEADPDKKALLGKVREKIAHEIEQRGLFGKDALNDLIKLYLKGEGVDNLRAMADNSSTIVAIAAKLEAIEKRTEVGRPERRATIAQQMRAQITKDDASKREWELFQQRKINNFKFEIRAAAPITIDPVGAPVNAPGNNGNLYVPGFETVPGLVDLPRNKPFMQGISNLRTISKPDVIWTEKSNPQGNAAMTAEGALKSMISFAYSTKRISAKKVTAFIKTSKENLDDIDWMAGEIEKELRYQIEIKVSQQLLSGDGIGENLTGLDFYAGGYVLTGISTANPNNADAIYASMTQIKTLNFTPTLGVMNPVDIANMNLQKAVDGHYILPPFTSTNGTVINGLRIQEENELPVGYLLMGDMSRFQVAVREGITIEYGWENDDFTRNMVTILGEMRLLSFVPDNETGAFVYDTLANIKTAITAA